jgi:AmmeMemoRadiSam system protein B/AmmeMemoRadiSam system protein A
MKYVRLFLFLVFWSVFLVFQTDCVFAGRVKEPNVAGAFYPEDPKELKGLIAKYMADAEAPTMTGTPAVLVVPHAGYIYSGPVAAYGFKTLSGMDFKTVVILAASHFFPYRGASIYSEGFFKTPLGAIEIDEELARSILSQDPELLSFEPDVFEQEHSIEVELPFLQSSLAPGFKIVPVLLGDMNYEECAKFAGYLVQAIKEKDILVLVSTDLSHYKPYAQALDYDSQTLGYVKNNDAKGLWDVVADTGWNVCGAKPLVTGMLYAKGQGAQKVSILKYANSGDTAGDKSRVVGYMSVLIEKTKELEVEGPMVQKQKETGALTGQEKKRLLEIVRLTIEANVSGKKIPALDEKAAALNLRRGVFVTLRKSGELKGCIGLFSSDEALYKVVSSMAIESSSHDYRFSPVSAQELKDIEIEISVLSEPQLIDDWRKIRLGTDGVIIRRGFSSGVFLPQVATETGWDLETFLSQLCFQKAGLPPDCYVNPAAKIYTFQADIFSEQEFKDK